jgi:hypothetical protein
MSGSDFRQGQSQPEEAAHREGKQSAAPAPSNRSFRSAESFFSAGEEQQAWPGGSLAASQAAARHNK